MKSFLLISVALLISLFALGQNSGTISVSKAPKQIINTIKSPANFIYVGISNPISPAQEIKVSNPVYEISSGKMDVVDGITYVRPTLDTMVIHLYKNSVSPSNFVGKQVFVPRLIPDPVVAIGGKSGGTIPKSHLSKQTMLKVSLKGCDFMFDGDWTVTGFWLSLKDGAYYKEFESRSENLTNMQIEELKKLASGDKFIFERITIADPGGRIRHVGAIVLNVL